MKNTGMVFLDTAGNQLRKGSTVYCTLPRWARGPGVRANTLFRCIVDSFSEKTCTVIINDERLDYPEPVRRYYEEVISGDPYEFD